jgi:predicted nucleic acid-binding Zn ribbon protein
MRRGINNERERERERTIKIPQVVILLIACVMVKLLARELN